MSKAKAKGKSKPAKAKAEDVPKARANEGTGRDVAVSTARVDRKVYDEFKARARRDGFVHVVDCLQVLLSLYQRGAIPDAALKACPPGISPAGPRRNPPYTWTLKVQRRLWDGFKAKAEKAHDCATDCLRLLVAGYAKGQVGITAAA